MIEDTFSRGQMPEAGGQMQDPELLRRYAEEKSEAAFGELVRRHLDFVYGCALRRVGGDAHLAEDVAQQVFAALARNAAVLVRHPVLSAWLFTTTRNISAELVRRERRRHTREQEAHLMNEMISPSTPQPDWERLRPALDDAMDGLAEEDRQAVLLRFFEGRSFAEVGAQLRLKENAARMRVERALDKLHALLARRGVTSTTAALAMALANQIGAVAPAGLAAAISGAALAGAAATSGGAGAVAAAGAGILSFMSTTKLFVATAVVVAFAAIGVATAAARQTRAIRAGIIATGKQQTELQTTLGALDRDLARVEQQAQASNAEAAQLLKAIQDAYPVLHLPAGDVPCLAFVIDTSGSMRSPQTGKLWELVLESIGAVLASHPDVQFLQGFDAAGGIIFSSRNEWLPRTPEILKTIEQALNRYDRDTASDPVPGIHRALRGLPTGSQTAARLHVCVIGDELNSAEQTESILRRLDQLNPSDATGKRRATISVVQLPTTVREIDGKMAGTGVKFQTLMTQVAGQHGGTFKLLPAGELR